MKQRFAIVTMRVPLRLDYPWKVAQPDAAVDIGEAVTDALRYKDYLNGVSSVKVTLVEKGEKGVKDAASVSRDELGDPVRDRGTQPTGDGGGKSS